MNKWTKIGILYLLILFASIFIVIGGKKRSLGMLFIESEITVSCGDIYNLCKLDKFKENLSILPCDDNVNSIESSQIITIGDSFFQSSLESLKFADELEKLSALRVYNVMNSGAYFNSQVDMPLAYFDSIHYVKGPRKFLVLETAERYSVKRALNYNKRNYLHKDPVNTINLKRLLDTSDVEYFVKNNKFTGKIYSWIQNVRFELFGTISASAFYNKKVPDVIFIREEVEFNRSFKSDSDVYEVVDNITKLASILNDDYNITLVHVIIPNKYSIYSQLCGESYDNFIPKIVHELKKRNVLAIDMYSIYSNYMAVNQDERLYFRGDTHYNRLGKALLVQEVSRTISGLVDIGTTQ